MNEPQTLDEIAQQGPPEVFIGRSQELTDFRRNLELAYSNPDRKFIWWVYGEAAAGKTTLLHRFYDIVAGRVERRDRTFLTAWVNEEESNNEQSVVAVMGAVAEQLEGQGADMAPFAARFNTYRQLNKEIQMDPQRPSGLSEILGRAAGHIGLAALKIVPVAGDLLAEAVGDQLVDKSGELFKFLTAKFGRHEDDVSLMLNPLKALTPLFVQALGRVAAEQPVALFFDTYEKIRSYLDPCLCGLLSGRYGGVSTGVLWVIAGRDNAPSNWLPASRRRLIKAVHLEAFTKEESRAYLQERQITDPAIVEDMVHLSRGLPGFLWLLVEQKPEDLAGVGDPTDEIVDRILKWVDEEAKKRAILSCALPRSLNLDRATVLLKDQAEPMFEFIKPLSFVTRVRRRWGKEASDTLWEYLRITRELMLRQRRQVSPDRWREMHVLLAGYFAAQRDALGLELQAGLRDSEWQQLDLEWLYHTICAQKRTAAPLWISRLLDIQEFGADDIYTQALSERVREAGEALEEDEIIAWGNKIALYQRDTPAETLPLLDALVSASKVLSPERQALLLVWRASTYILVENYTAAIEDLDVAVQLQPQEGIVYSLRGCAHLGMGDLTEALADVERAIEWQPEQGIAYYLRAQISLSLGNTDLALADFNQAVDRGYIASDDYPTLALIHLIVGHYPAALEEINQAIEAQPGAWQNYPIRVAVRMALGNLLEALTDTNQVLQLRPHSDAYFIRGLVQQTMGDARAALADFNQAIELQPQNGLYYLWRGRTYLELGNLEAARSDLDQALSRLPQNGRIYLIRGELRMSEGDKAGALADWKHALELSLPAADRAGGQALLHQAEGNREAALADLSRVIEVLPGAGHGYRGRGQVYLALGNPQAALHDFNRAIELQPQSAWNYVGRASTYLALGDMARALQDSNRSIELLPENGSPYAARAGIYMALQDKEQALSDLQQALDLGLQAIGESTARGLMHLLTGDFLAALSNFNRVIELQPLGLNYFLRGQTHMALGTPQAALADLKQATEMGFQGGGNALVQAQLQLSLGQFQEAVDGLNRAIELQPGNGVSYYVRAGAHLALDNLTLAQADIDRAIELLPESVDSYFIRGMIRQKLGDHRAALGDFNRALELQPQNGMTYLYRAMSQVALGY